MAASSDHKEFARLVGSRVRALRLAAGLDRRSLAARADVTVSLIRDTEQGISRPMLDHAAKIARGLGVAVDVLIARDGPTAPTPGRGRPRKMAAGY